jgi:hypothetical protein
MKVHTAYYKRQLHSSISAGAKTKSVILLLSWKLGAITFFIAGFTSF